MSNTGRFELVERHRADPRALRTGARVATGDVWWCLRTEFDAADLFEVSVADRDDRIRRYRVIGKVDLYVALDALAVCGHFAGKVAVDDQACS